MPISRGEFEQGEIDLRSIVVGFLRTNSDSAFSLEEIIGQLTSEGISSISEEVVIILTELVDKKRVETKSIDGVAYYIYCNIIGFRHS